MFASDYTVGCDAHRHFSLFAVLDGKGDLVERTRAGHVPGAIGATARYLAESTYWVLKKSEPYREPPHWAPEGMNSTVSLSQGQARA